MTSSEKRLPGQTNADYENHDDPNAQFIGTQSLQGGGDPSFMYRGLRAVLSWLDRRKGRRSH
jgi:hypothetical protein